MGWTQPQELQAPIKNSDLVPSKTTSHYSKIIITRKLYRSSYKKTSSENDIPIAQIPTVPKVNYEG